MELPRLKTPKLGVIIYPCSSLICKQWKVAPPPPIYSTLHYMKIEEESKTPGLHGIPHLGRQRLVLCSCECCKKNEHLPHPNNKDHGKAMSKVVIASKSNMSWKRDHRHASNWGASASMRGYTFRILSSSYFVAYYYLLTEGQIQKNWREIFHDKYLHDDV